MTVEAPALIPVEEYLTTSYSPDREYRDGVLVERNVGDSTHARLQTLLSAYMVGHEKEWGIEVFTELRIQIRERWYRIPDICAYSLPVPKGRYPEQPPLLWIEILSEDDKMVDVWAKAAELVKSGVPYVWIIEPHTLNSELWTASGAASVEDHVLRIPNTGIVIPLRELITK